MAISLAIIALGYVGIVAAILFAVRKANQGAAALRGEVADLRRELAPTIQAVNQLAGSGADLGGKVKDEVMALLKVSRGLRRRVVRGARRVEGRLQDLDALYEVVSGEVEETALQVATTLKTVRSGASALSRIKRFLRRR